MLRWFRAFLPKEERFFDLFARHAQTVVQGALALQDMLRGGEETPVFCQRVNQFENDADGITREVLTAVRRTFITPFDRGDIKNLITAMDDAIDQMQQTAKAVVLFEVRTFEPPMREIATLLVECANLVGRALPLMQSIGDNVAMLTAITEEIGKAGGPHRRPPRHRVEGAVSQAPQRQLDGFRRRRRDLQASRKSVRPLRRRRQRDQLDRDRTGIGQGQFSGCHAWSSDSDLSDRGRAAVRLPQRSARRRQFDRHHRVDPRAAPAIRGDLGRLLQFHRLRGVRAPRRQYDRHRHHRARASSMPA